MSKTNENARRRLARGLVLAVSLHAFEQIAIVAILEDVVSDLNGRDFSGVIFGVYLLASILASVIAGTYIDRHGPRGAFAFGLSSFALGLLGATLANSIELLIAARAVQGAGGGLLLTVAYASINIAYDEGERPAILARLSMAWIAPGLLGPPLAAALAGLPVLEWRWVFVSLLPFAPLVAWFALPAMRGYSRSENPPARAAHPTKAGLFRSQESRRIMLAVALCAGAALLQFGSVQSQPAAMILSLLPGAGLTLFALVKLMPTGTLWLRPVLPAAIALKLASHFAFFGTDSFIPFSLQEVRGYSLFLASLAIAPSALTWAAASVLVARFQKDAARSVAFVRAGFVTMAIGIALALPVLRPEVSIALMFFAWGVAGFGVGCAYLSLNAIAMRETDALANDEASTHSDGDENKEHAHAIRTGARVGHTAVALNIADSLGFAFGSTAGGAILFHAARAGAAPADQFSLVWGLHLLVAIVCVIFAGRLHSRRRP
ncbi:MAG: MFS transporter [bacterium]|nr:MFS transporter [bacterium]